MNKKGFIEDINWAAAGLAVLGAFGSFWYADYLTPDAGFGTRIFAGLATLVVGYFVAWWIIEH